MGRLLKAVDAPSSLAFYPAVFYLEGGQNTIIFSGVVMAGILLVAAV